MKQLQIHYDAGLTAQYPEFIDVVRAAVYSSGQSLKVIAADLDMSQSELSRKLSNNPNDPRRKLSNNPNDPRNFAVDDLSHLLSALGPDGNMIIHWLAEKHLETPRDPAQVAMEMINQIAPVLNALQALLVQQGDGKVSSIRTAK